MPQYHTSGGSVAYPDSKSTYPAFPQVGFGKAIAIGLGTGLLGAAVMAGTAKVEQLFTNRPNSYVPGRTVSTHLGLSSTFGQHPDMMNQVHHYGMGILAGPVRAAMSYYGVIGPIASFAFALVRIAMDQVVELGAGVSALPWTWPINEQVVDMTHKSIYALVVGYMCDKLVRGVDWFNY
ncbi:hypothetical protein BDV95DRAFT_202691 [Massariosphaeria phaeospora]|uniref:Uncharacterized protein n=1 Tax=Massariosphaeria phaeospora TaxID=100035 RepID=A0A7C8I7S3_9PLEO|nr:hypothetical protein BDV95DRAFT_202691 [Massariosphaeria phaeospora]